MLQHADRGEVHADRPDDVNGLATISMQYRCNPRSALVTDIPYAVCMALQNTTQAVQRLLDDLAAKGDAPDDPLIRSLLGRSVNRLQMLCGRLLHGSYPRLTQSPAYLETNDLVGAVTERLIKALKDVRPETTRQFFGLANRHIRWELNDLARRVDQQPRHVAAGKEPTAPPAREADTDAHAQTQTLMRILACIESLPDDEREVFEYVRIQGMTHAEAAELLGVAEKTIQRRLRRSVLLLADGLRDLVDHQALESASKSEDTSSSATS